MIPGTEPCETCHGNGWYGVHQARCWKCKGTGIQLCQFCQRHAAEYTAKGIYEMSQRWACGICVGHVKPFEEIVMVRGFPTKKEREAQVATMDRATSLILHRKDELETKEWDHEFGRTDEEDEELEALRREFPLPDYKGFVKVLTELHYNQEDPRSMGLCLWHISCHARKLVKQEEEVTI